MRKISSLFVLAVLFFSTVHAQVRIGLQGSVLFCNGSLKQPNANTNGSEDVPGKKSSTGYKFGVIANIPLAESVAFMPELNFTNKGLKTSQSQSETFQGITIQTSSDSKASLNFVEIPLNIAYMSTGGTGSFFAGAGPVLSLGLSGKSKVNQKQSITGYAEKDTSFNVTIKFDGKKDKDITDPNDNNGHLKRMEIGVNAFAGYMMDNGLFVKASYYMGFNNLDPNDNTVYKTNYFGIGVGFMFGKKNTKESGK